jgi:hypothetical protein
VEELQVSDGPYREAADAPLSIHPLLQQAEVAERAARALTEAAVLMGSRSHEMDGVVGFLINYAAFRRADYEKHGKSAEKRSVK